MELACGLGATVLLVVILTVIYHFYWLEMVLFYRAHFGTDETILGKGASAAGLCLWTSRPAFLLP